MKKRFWLGLAVGAMMVGMVGMAEASFVQWQTSAGGNGHYYELVNVPMNFTDSVSNATTKGGYLATPNLAGEASFIATSLIAPSGGAYYWLDEAACAAEKTK